MQAVKPDRAVILNVTIFCEAGLLLVATCWCFVAEMSLAQAMLISVHSALVGVLGGVATAASGFFLLFLSRIFKSLKFLGALRKIIEEEVIPLFVQLKLSDIVLVAACTGFCEEIFFRGVLQERFGLIPASILFGLVHCPSVSMIPYAFWTFVAGLFLGWMYDWTHSLWTPILAHFISNLMVLLIFRYRPQKN